MAEIETETETPIERDNETLSEGPVTPSDLADLSDSKLTNRIRKSVQLCQRFERPFMAELRNKLLPMLNVAVKRIKAGKKSGESFNGCNTVNEFCESVGLNPSTMRMWRRRAKLEAKHQRQLEGAIAGPQESQHAQITVEKVISASTKLMTKIDAIKGTLSEEDRRVLVDELWNRGNELLNLCRELSMPKAA